MIFLVSKAHFVTYTQYVYDMDQIANKIKWKIIIKNMIQYMPSFYFRTTDFHTRNVLQHKRTKTPLVVCYVVFFSLFCRYFYSSVLSFYSYLYARAITAYNFTLCEYLNQRFGSSSRDIILFFSLLRLFFGSSSSLRQLLGVTCIEHA